MFARGSSRVEQNNAMYALDASTKRLKSDTLAKQCGRGEIDIG